MPGPSYTPDRFPCLLDRVLGDRVQTRDAYRLRVVRDLEWLLNARGAPWRRFVDGALIDPMSDFPEIRSSVLNYGLPSHLGDVLTEEVTRRIEADLHRVLTDFEPRIVPGSLTVASSKAPSDGVARFDLSFDLWSIPLPESMRAVISIEVLTGKCGVGAAESGD